jgi:hypothetical protein
LLSTPEIQRVRDINCEDTLMSDSSNQLFGGEFPTNRINYNNVIIRCPNDCLKVTSSVLGLGIHPRESPICLSAIIDHSISIYGGLVSIGIYQGLKTYSAYSMRMFGIDVRSHDQASMTSFVTSKVDNVDMVERNIRILNAKGEISSRGRLELRLNGVWGTICITGNDNFSAVAACKSMGYRFGRWGNYVNSRNQQTMGYCKNFMSENHCGAEFQRIHYYNIKCLPNSQNLYGCHKQLAELTVCNHNMDAIIICSNDNYETATTIPEGIVKFGANYSQSIDNRRTIGRIEMSSGDRYKPICASETNKEAANVICRMMGYAAGNNLNMILSNHDSIRQYKYTNANNDIGFALGAVKCKGNESHVNNCIKNLHVTNCSHDNDLILECIGNGDPLAVKQTQKKMVNPPALGKLPIPFLGKLNCQTQGFHEMFRGDPGSVFIIFCPKNCKAENVPVKGTALYSADSGVCKAAIHAGLIVNEKGGQVGVTKTYGSNYYEGSPFNGIISETSNETFSSSFSFTRVNSSWERMDKISKTKVKPKNPILQKLQSVANKVKNFFQNKIGNVFRRSFLEQSVEIEPQWQPTYQFFSPNIGYVFSPQTTISEKANFTTLSKFTILVTFTMNNFYGNRQFIFSYSGCGGFNIYIDRDASLKFGDPCKPENRIKTGIFIAFNDKISLYISYVNGVTKYRTFSERNNFPNELITENTVLTMENGKTIGIGRVGDENQDAFYGFIDFVFVFNDNVPENQVAQLVASLIKKNQNSKANRIVHTKDERICVSTCIPSLPPPSAEAGTPPREAYADPTVVDNKTFNSFATVISTPNLPLLTNVVNLININPFTTNNIMDSNNIQTKEIECNTTLMDPLTTNPLVYFPTTPDRITRVKCPDCKNTTFAVFGSDIYHPMSSICKAAAHAGVLKTAGEILVKIMGEKKVFHSSKANDIDSIPIGGSNTSFSIDPAQEITSVTCSTTATMDKFGQAPIYSRFVVRCPNQCSQVVTDIIGSEVYTDTSSICKAAIHYGVLTDNGGEVDFMIGGGQNYYPTTNGFGIISRVLPSSYVRSFSFLGTRVSLIYSYKELYEGNIFDKWDPEKQPDVLESTDDFWSFYIENIINSSNVVKSVKSIMHKGRIKSTSPINYASLIKLKGAEWTNGYILVSVISYDPNPVGILFRYKNKFNYYSLILDFSKPDANVKLVSMVNSTYNTLMVRTHKLLLQTRYEVIISTEFDNFQIFLNTAGVNEFKNIMTIKNNELQRGTLAIATYGNSHFLLPGIQVTPQLPRKNDINSKRTFTSILSHIKEKDKKDFCKSIFGTNQYEYDKCLLDQVFCSLLCEEIPDCENIIAFNCYKTCIRSIKQKTTLIPFQSFTWLPKEKIDVDFIPINGPGYIAGFIISIETIGSDQYATIKYRDDYGTDEIDRQKYDGNNIKQCGSVLTGRTDCKLN